MKLKVIISQAMKKALTVGMLAAALVVMILPAMGAITVNPSNALSSAEDGFNYGGELGISLLTIAAVVGAIMFGWRLRHGRGK